MIYVVIHGNLVLVTIFQFLTMTLSDCILGEKDGIELTDLVFISYTIVCFNVGLVNLLVYLLIGKLLKQVSAFQSSFESIT